MPTSRPDIDNYEKLVCDALNKITLICHPDRPHVWRQFDGGENFRRSYVLGNDGNLEKLPARPHRDVDGKNVYEPKGERTRIIREQLRGS